MKSLFAIIAGVLISANVFAQAPESMSYQAVVRDNNDNLMANTAIGMQISILQGSITGTAVYVETQTPTSNTNGLVSLELGAGTLVSGDFSTIDWANGPYFLKTETDPTGGSTYTITGSSQLLSVPYALHAKTAETVVGVGSGGFIHYIGELYGGGVVFHVYRDSSGAEHGLVVSLTNVSDSAQWGLDSIDVPNCESSWNGQANTTAILNAGGLPTDAAGLCDAFNGGGFTDWYLPAIDELNTLYNNRVNVNMVLSTAVGAAEIVLASDALYLWASTEHTVSKGYAFDIKFGFPNSLNYHIKTNTYYVRAVRDF